MPGGSGGRAGCVAAGGTAAGGGVAGAAGKAESRSARAARAGRVMRFRTSFIVVSSRGRAILPDVGRRRPDVVQAGLHAVVMGAEGDDADAQGEAVPEHRTGEHDPLPGVDPVKKGAVPPVDLVGRQAPP